MQSLDIWLVRTPVDTIGTRVYRKKTPADQYLNHQSNHPIDQKKSVVNTLLHRSDIIVSQAEDKEKENAHITKALQVNGYPKWIIKKQQKKNNRHENSNRRDSQNRSGYQQTVVLPYVKGLSERIRSVLKLYNIQTSFSPHVTLRNLLVHPKDQTKEEDKTGMIHQIECIDHHLKYIGETERKVFKKLKNIYLYTCASLSSSYLIWICGWFFFYSYVFIYFFP